MINSTKKINAIVSGIIIASLIIVSCKKKDDTVAATTTTNACGVAAPAASYNGPVGIGDTIQFKAAAISGASYKWTGPKSFVSYTQNPTLVFAKGMEGDYSVTATAGGCTSEAYHVYVTNCEITAKADSAVTGGSLNLYASTIMGPTNQPIDATYSWTGPNTYTSSVQNPVISAVTTAAIGTYTVVATTSGGHKSQPATVTVIITPAAPTLSTNSPRTVGTSLTLTAQNIAGAKYTWSGPNGFSLIDTTNNVITINNVSRAAAGTYYVTYKVSGVTSKQGKATVAINYSANGCGSLTEITYNSKTYGVVQIGTTQCWMTSNVKGANGIDSLFTWTDAMASAVQGQGVCPTGWHIPTDSVWQSLASYVANDGNALKTVGQGTGAGAGTNTSGFSAYLINGTPAYKTALFWSVTDYSSASARYMKLAPDNNTIYLGADVKTVKYAVRCLKD